MVIHIFCKLEKASYNVFFIRAVMVKSLYTLQLSSGYNDLLNSENLKVAIAQLCHDIQLLLSYAMSYMSEFLLCYS